MTDRCRADQRESQDQVQQTTVKNSLGRYLNLKQRVLLAFLLLWHPFWEGCAEDRLSTLEANIEVTIYEPPSSNYLEVNSQTRTINLGEVAVTSRREAFFRIHNPSANTLSIRAVSYNQQESAHSPWHPIQWLNNKTDQTPENFPTEGLRLVAGAYLLIVVPFEPQEEGDASTQLSIISNAVNHPIVPISVIANGTYYGQPIIEIEYNGELSPLEGECNQGICSIHDTRGLDFRNIGIGLSGSNKIIVRNKATCAPYPGADSCEPCLLRIASSIDSTMAFRFKEGTNTSGHFAIVHNQPFDVQQADVECESTGEDSRLIAFNAPNEEGSFETTLLIESNDPDKRTIALPIRAQARNAPIAIAELRPCSNDVLNDCHDSPEPLTRVYLDGSKSYDPATHIDANTNSQGDAGEYTGIVSYQWEVVEAPNGVNPDDYDWAGINHPIASFWTPIAGHYAVRLYVSNGGVWSGDTQESLIEFDAHPSSMLHVQLVWDHPSNDQDLHLTYVDENPNLCSSQWDCYYANRRPEWFRSHLAGEPDSPNPRLDKDDTNGLGPENINIDRPAPGTYRVYLHYYPWGMGSNPTRNTLRIYLGGILRFSEMRTLTAEEQVWAAAEITWRNDDTNTGYGEVTPFRHNTNISQVGAVAYRDPEACWGDEREGWTFPSP